MSEKSRKIQLCFFIQTHAWWARFIYLSIAFMSILIFFEPPSSAAITVCSQHWFNFSSAKPICDNKEIIRDWEAWTLFVEFLLIMVSVRSNFLSSSWMLMDHYFGCTSSLNILSTWVSLTTYFQHEFHQHTFSDICYWYIYESNVYETECVLYQEVAQVSLLLQCTMYSVQCILYIPRCTI